jgi:hypothetical protein
MSRLSAFAALLLVSICFASSGAREAADKDQTPIPRIHRPGYPVHTIDPARPGLLRAAAAVDTFILAEYDFDGPAGPDVQGWTGHDRTRYTVPDTFFHVADATELTGGDIGRLIVLEGSQSMWCGLAPAAIGAGCSYATLPGYGNNWQQFLRSAVFFHTGDVTLSYLLIYHLEPAEDYAYLRYLDIDGQWRDLTSYTYFGSGNTPLFESFVIPDSLLGDTVRISFEVDTDGAWSDEDGMWPTDGAIIIDSLRLSDEFRMINFQDFEAELPGASATNDGFWRATTLDGRGDFSALFPGLTVLQEAPCAGNATALWGFFDESTEDYSCGGHPEQAAVPTGPVSSYSATDYVSNEIWSPFMEWNTDRYGAAIPATAQSAFFEFDVYRDLPVGNLVFYHWSVRSLTAGCESPWVDDNTVYYGDRKDWYRHRAEIGNYIEIGAEQIQVALRTVDMCYVWCGVYGDGSCHSHAPLFDNVRVGRIDVSGPSWANYPFDFFTDNFSADGTLTGTVRMDIALLKGAFLPRDTATVRVYSNAGIDYHVPGDQGSGGAVYCHVKDVSPAKSGSAISDNLTKNPLVSTGGGWTVLQCYTGYQGPRFTIDLNDALYQPGDTVWYYFSARDGNGATNYWSLHTGAVSTEAAVRAAAMEVTCLPANALGGGTDILYVDGCDGTGARPYFESAFSMLGISPDRFDIIDPLFDRGGGPGVRVKSVIDQLLSVYKKIIWNTGYLRDSGIQDGVPGLSWQRSSDDFGMLLEFLDYGANGPGVYLSGDNLASSWLDKTGSGAGDLRSIYMNFNLVAEAHTSLGEPVSPLVTGLAGSCFEGPSGADTLIAFGGDCSGVNDFDVLEPYGTASVEMAYSGNPARGAVVSQATVNIVGDTARVLLSGFSYHAIRDNKPAGVPARARHLAAILRWLENDVGDPVDSGQPAPPQNALAQNVPNPFNPSTTIEFTVSSRAHVELTVYDVGGRRVRTLASEVRTPGTVHRVQWNGRGDNGEEVASGVYFYRLTTGDYTRTKKMVLLK